MMYLVKTPAFIPVLFPKYWWQLQNTREIYLTFDDGPTPGVTDWVLSVLRQFQAKATFFLVGNNVKNYPAVAQKIIENGHKIGNHTYTHVHGWKVSPAKYLEEVSLTDDIIFQKTGAVPLFFRPPYGKFSRFARSGILQRHQIVMWDVLPGDFDQNLSFQTCLANALAHIAPGAIYVLHDSLKCQQRMQYVLPILLETIYSNGFICSALPEPVINNHF